MSLRGGFKRRQSESSNKSILSLQSTSSDNEEDSVCSTGPSGIRRNVVHSLQDVAMALERGVEVRDRRYGSKIYRDSFIASEAVTFLVLNGMAKSRRSAVDLMRQLQKKFNLFQQVTAMAQQNKQKKQSSLKKKLKRTSFSGRRGRKRRLRRKKQGEGGSDDGAGDDDSAIQGALSNLSETSSNAASSTKSGATVRTHSSTSTVQVDFNDGYYFFCFTHPDDRFHSSLRTKKPLSEIATSFEKGVKRRDYMYRLRRYKNTFVGSKAIDFLVRTRIAQTRTDAVRIGNALVEKYNLFQPAVPGCIVQFSDDNFLYRFTPPAERKEVRDDDEDEYKFSEFLINASMKGRGADDLELKNVIEIFTKGVKLCTNQYRGKEYRHTFVGSEAVSFIVNSNLAKTRRDAVTLGKKLMEEKKIFSSALPRERTFKDDNLLYVFTEDHDGLDGTTNNDGDKTKTGADVTGGTGEMLLQEIAEKLRNGVETKNRRVKWKLYKNTFVGSDAVDFLVGSGIAESRIGAVALGRQLALELNLFEHITENKKNVKENKKIIYLKDKKSHIYRFIDKDEMNEDSDIEEIFMETPQLMKISESLERNLQLKSNKMGLRVFPNTFIGSEAVSYMVDNGHAKSRSEAVQVGRLMSKELCLFDHVTQNQKFSDDINFYYRFSNIIERPKTLTLKKVQATRNIFGGMDPDDILDDSERREKNRREKFDKKSLSYATLQPNSLAPATGLMRKPPARRPPPRGLPGKTDQDPAADQSNHSQSNKDKDYSASEADDSLGDFPVFSNSGVGSDRVSLLSQDWESRAKNFEMRALDFGTSKAVIDDAALQEEKTTADKAMDWMSSFLKIDPRYQMRYFFDEVAQDGAASVEEDGTIPEVRPLFRFMPNRAAVFTVWRPTSKDAIKKMMLGEAVGKGLDIKGKSAKRGKNSAFVPFRQISNNAHKKQVTKLSKDGRVRLFFSQACRRSRDIVAEGLETMAEEMIDCVAQARKLLSDSSGGKIDEATRKDAISAIKNLEMDDPTILYIDDYAPKRYGLEMSVRLFWEAYFVRQDISCKPGTEYDSGRPSQPTFQDMNLATVCSKPKTKGAPKAVIYQRAHKDTPFNPFELLMAYEEHGHVMPVVSDFDCFLVGTKRVSYTSPLAQEQLDVLKWCVKSLEMALDTTSGNESWTGKWLEILREANRNGFHPDIPPFGFSDPKSYSIMENAVDRLKMTGAVRHGAECFNYYFPQDLDDEFLVIADNLEGNVPWKYVDVDGLQNILSRKIDEGYTFPLNPKWILCDGGRWRILYHKLMNAKGHNQVNTIESMNVWFPISSGLREDLARISAKHPEGFYKSAPVQAPPISPKPNQLSAVAAKPTLQESAPVPLSTEQGTATTELPRIAEKDDQASADEGEEEKKEKESPINGNGIELSSPTDDVKNSEEKEEEKDDLISLPTVKEQPIPLESPRLVTPMEDIREDDDDDNDESPENDEAAPAADQEESKQQPQVETTTITTNKAVSTTLNSTTPIEMTRSPIQISPVVEEINNREPPKIITPGAEETTVSSS